MIKETLSLLNDKPNIFDFPQATINQFLIDEEDKEIFLSTVKIFTSKSKSHFSSKYVNFHVSNGFKYIDIVKISDYPLPVAYNKTTSRGIINLSAIGRKNVSNISMRDMYALVLASHVCSCLSGGAEISVENSEPFCEYLTQVFLKIFSRKYGLTGTYVNLIPQLRFLLSLYIYCSFFGVSQKDAMKKASHFSKLSEREIKIDFKKYNFGKIDDLLLALSDAQVTPGLTKYSFLDIMIRHFGTLNLPLFEDVMRFSSILMSSSINGNTIFPPMLQMYNQKLYLKVNSIIEGTIDKAM